MRVAESAKLTIKEANKSPDFVAQVGHMARPRQVRNDLYPYYRFFTDDTNARRYRAPSTLLYGEKFGVPFSRSEHAAIMWT